MKIAIVGSEGYVGSALVPALVGHDLLRLDAGVWRDLEEGAVFARTSHQILKRLRKCEPDHVVYLAALAHDPAGVLTKHCIDDNNVVIPFSVFSGSLKVPCTFISSLSVFSMTAGYPQSKRDLESMLFSEIEDDFLERVNILRFGTLFGPSKPAAMRTHLLLNKMVLDAVNTGVITVSNPALRRPVYHISSAVNDIVQDIFDLNPRGQVKNRLQHCDTLGAYARKVAAAIGAEVKEGSPDLDERDYGWNVQHTHLLTCQIHVLARWYKENKLPPGVNAGPWEALRSWSEQYYA